MALKKSELYSSLWSSCDALRGGMDASQYKDYVLVMLFIKYISDKYAGKVYQPIQVPAGASFNDLVALKGKPDIGDRINKQVLQKLAEVNHLSDFPDFNDDTKLGSGKEKSDRLTDLISIFENPALDFSRNRAEGDDILGDAYEYLMRNFATESGKSKGQFYTPAEVSRIIAQVLGIHQAQTSAQTTAYDPTCGSGSLLLKVADAAPTKITLYGQENDSATAALARMNMILHNNPEGSVVQGNTLANPKFLEGSTLKTFDYVVANPPFSDKRWSLGVNVAEDPHGRFESFGVPPAKQGDYAYLLHIIRSMKSTGHGACILPHGVLFRGNAEAEIRRNLIRKGYIKAIIGLPANLFYGTGIPACIVVLDKSEAAGRNGIFMIDASKGFIKDGPKNRLREQDIHKIVDAYTKQLELPRYSRLVPISEIVDAKNDYNLNLPRYIDTTEPEDLQDIHGHLNGGIPMRDIDALAYYWQIIPNVRSTLFSAFPSPVPGANPEDQQADLAHRKVSSPRVRGEGQGEGNLGYLQLNLPIAEVKQAILGHAEFKTFNDTTKKLFAQWRNTVLPQLKAFDKDGKPKPLITDIAESLLATFKHAPLLDAYDVYQHLMDYWDSTMQDDCYLVADDGWIESAKPKLIVEDKNKKTKTKPDLVLGKKKYQCELIPPTLIIQRWFAKQQTAIEQIESEVAALQQQLEELAEEHGGDEGLLSEARNDKDKLTKASVAQRLKQLTVDKGEWTAEEEAVLKEYLALVDKEAAAADKLSAAQQALIEQVAAKYSKLSEAEIKTLVVEDKWLATLAADVQSELDRVSQTLTGRIRQLAERYATPLPKLMDEVAALQAKVETHLQKMGVVVNG